MRDVIKKVPVPVCGVMLGAAALGLAIGSAAFWFGFVTLILLLVLVTYDGMCSEYGTSTAVLTVCSSGGDDHCSCIGGIYIHQIYGIYF